jgi:hypothetical protein
MTSESGLKSEVGKMTGLIVLECQHSTVKAVAAGEHIIEEWQYDA